MTINTKLSENVETLVNDGLSKARKNLLDLSGRNRLLNFKHSGAKILRFVDELPNQIYEHLLEDEKKGFLITPVPLPKKSDYPEIEEKEDLKKIEAGLHARKLGIQTDWNLGTSEVPVQPHHQDDKLQTLHFPEELDRRVRRIHSEAKTVIEESGVNMLFLCLGFLKWSDHSPTDNYSYAPLILVPIEIQRHSVDAKTGFAKFRLLYTGEDILDNICLREKLAQMAIALPSFEDYETPEKYFRDIATILEDTKPEWSIERFATIGFLSFGKMLMYLDLDPEKWPEDEGILDSGHIQDIFTGNHSSGDLLAAEFDLDGDTSLPHFSHIMNADSSQHSAIIDVINGRNLVIEGPPGTGKSQTITNLIAACLEQGKTVLFVAEKSAALQVVQKRLDSLGLGHFCLSLHSHKMQKKALMSDLKDRLELNNSSFRTAAKTAELRASELRTKKHKLIEYSTAMNTAFGALEETPHNIFWKADVLKAGLANKYSPDAFVPPSSVENISASDMRLYADLLNDLGDTLREYFQANNVNANHYWAGLNISSHTDYSMRQNILKSFKALFISAADAESAIAQLEKLGLQDTAFTDLLNELERLSVLTAKNFEFAKHVESIDPDILLISLKGAGEVLVKERKAEMALEVLLQETKISRQAANTLDEKRLTNSIPKDVPLSVLAERFGRLGKTAQNVFAQENNMNEAINKIGMATFCTTLPQLTAILVSTKLLTETAPLPWTKESEEVEQSAHLELLKRIQEKVSSLGFEKEELSTKFDLKALPTREVLNGILEGFKAKSLLSPLSAKWRANAATFKSFSLMDFKNIKNCTGYLQRLVDFIDECEKFKNDSEANQKLPSVFKGIETDAQYLSSTANYYLNLRTHIVNQFGASVYDALKRIDVASTNWLKERYEDFSKSFQAISEIKASLDSDGFNKSDKIQDILAAAKQSAGEFSVFSSYINELEIPSNLTISEIVSVQKGLNSYKKAQTETATTIPVQRLGLDVSVGSTEQKLIVVQSLIELSQIVLGGKKQFATSLLLSGNGFESLESLRKLKTQISPYIHSLAEIYRVIPTTDWSKEFLASVDNTDAQTLRAINEKSAKFETHKEGFDKWCDIRNGVIDCDKSGLGEVVTSFLGNTTTPVNFSEFVSLFDYLVYHELSGIALSRNKVLGSFSRLTHENIRASFGEIDIELQRLNAQKLAYELSRKPIPEGLGGKSPKEFTDRRLIQHEIGKQKAHVSIRRLVLRAYDALVALKPCFMMGPLSVAQYLEPGRQKFDILIMDEASQVKPADAIGMLARAKQVVIVGDSNQLPPTGFFDTLGSDDDGDTDGTTIQDSESILDVCKPLFQPLRRLRWHYRSQHQSLISFSNKHFYDDDLVIFPSPAANSNIAGVRHVYVQDGVYQSQCNAIEAQAVVQQMVELTTVHPHLTCGIVTLNAKQKAVIEDEIERVRKDNPQFDSFIGRSEETDEAFFVKNLENVQGDERDVIFISTTFGLDDAGTWRQNFGPINGKDGWRRLNVLFTRAKQHVRIFSSFLPERIKVDDTKEQRGLKALRDYLQFAITGIDQLSYQTDKEPDSDFERAVGSFLKSKGYQIVYQLGVAGYRIDMVVCHPRDSTSYALAIECDGATYHSAKSARDRDRLREENLRKLGWNKIHRIWSTDWFKHRSQEEKRLLEAVQSAIV